MFFVAGLIGLAGAGVRGRPLVIGVLGFSGGGFTTAILVVALLNFHLIEGSPARALMGFAIPRRQFASLDAALKYFHHRLLGRDL